MTDTEMLDEISAILETGAARLGYNEDDEMLFDDWGKIPIGFHLRTRSCVDFDISAPTLRELFIEDREIGKKIKNFDRENI